MAALRNTRLAAQGQLADALLVKHILFLLQLSNGRFIRLDIEGAGNGINAHELAV